MYGKDRLSAFFDAVLAIIMTILVLELEMPAEITLEGLWAMRMSFLAYGISFFWLGSMWINIHNEWDRAEQVSVRTIWFMMLLMFASSFFPYATALVSADFGNAVAQVFYGVDVLAVTFFNLAMYRSLSRDNPGVAALRERGYAGAAWIRVDIAVKIVGLVLAVTVFPQAMLLSVLLTLVVLVIPRQIRGRTEM